MKKKNLLGRVFIISLILFALPIGVFGAWSDNITTYYGFNTVGSEFEDLLGWQNITNSANSNTTNTSGFFGGARDVPTTGNLLTGLDIKMIANSLTGYSASNNRGYTVLWSSFLDTVAGVRYEVSGGSSDGGGNFNPLYKFDNAGASIETSVRRGAGDTQSNATVTNISTWYSNAIVPDIVGGTWAYYRNGVLISNTTNSVLSSFWANQSIAFGGRGGTFDGRIDEVFFINRTLSASEIFYYYNGGNLRSCTELNCTGAANNVTVQAYDFYTNQTLFNLTVYENNTILCQTTSGLCTLPYKMNSSSTYNLLINATDNRGYFNLSLPSQSVALNINKAMSQSSVTFFARQKVSGLYINTTSFFTNYSTNNTHYMRAQSYNVTAFPSGYFNQTSNYSAVPFFIGNYTFANMSNAIVNVTARDFLFGTSLTIFNITVFYPAYGITDYYSTTNGSIQFLSINNTALIITLNSSFYFANSTSNTTANTSFFVNNFTISSTPTSSIVFQFYDEQTLVPVTNVTYQIFSLGYSGTFNSGTSFVNLSILPNSDYEIRYGINSTIYFPRSYYFRIPFTTVENTNLTLFMINQSLGTIFQRTVVNTTSIPLVNYTLVVIRAYPQSGNNSYIYRVVAMDRTDNNGNAVFYAIPNSQAYAYYLYYNFSLVFTFAPEFLTSATGQLIASNPINTLYGFQTVSQIQSTLVYSNSSQNFVATYNDPNNRISAMCLTIQYRNGIISSSNTTCSSSYLGTITIPASNNVSGSYIAFLISYVGTYSQQINDETVNFRTTTNTRSLVGWALFGLCVLLGATLGAYINPIAGLGFIIISATVLGTTYLGFFLFSEVIQGGLIVIAVVTILLWRN